MAGGSGGTVDPFTGLQISEFSDLYRYLNTSPKHPKKSATTTDGVIQNVVASGTRDLDALRAYQVRQVGVNPMTLSFANKVNEVNVKKNVSCLRLDTGSLKSFFAGGDIVKSQLNASGTISSVSIGGNLKGTASVNADGPNGRILSITTKKALLGHVFGEVGIGTIKVGTDLGSDSVTTNANLDTLNVAGNLLGGSSVDVNDKLSKLIVGGSVMDGAVVRAGSIGSQSIGGGVEGDIIID